MVNRMVENAPAPKLAVAPKTKRPRAAGIAAGSTTALIRYLWAMRSVMGVSRLSNLTPLDYLRIPVVAAIRPSARTGQITTCQGKGLRLRSAITGALMESAERFSCSEFSDTVEMKQSQLTGEKLDGTNAPEGNMVEAVWGTSLISRKSLAVRASAVLFPYHRWSSKDLGPRPNTSGLAAGATPNHAILNALLELVERDAVSRFFEGEDVFRIEVSAITDPASTQILNRFRERKIDVLIARLRTIPGIESVKAFALDNLSCQSHLAVTGQAADLVLSSAIRKALLEICQARATAIQASREDFSRYRTSWKAQYSEVRETFEFLRGRLGQHDTPLALMLEEPPLTEPLAIALRAISSAGYSEAIAFDLTNEQLDIPVFRVLVPGLADTFIGNVRVSHHAS
jgi:YcaO-like protein with predicted kinase domain